MEYKKKLKTERNVKQKIAFVSFIVTPSTEALSYRKPSSAGIFHVSYREKRKG